MQRRQRKRRMDNRGIRREIISAWAKLPYMAVEMKRATTYVSELQRMREFREYLRKKIIAVATPVGTTST
jgi:hypothetical protein